MSADITIIGRIGFPLAEQVQVGTVKYANFNHDYCFPRQGRQVCPKKSHLSTIRHRIEEEDCKIETTNF
jgi:hypothetical protein